MTTQERASRSMQLQALCDGVRKYVDTRNYQKCVAMICYSESLSLSGFSSFGHTASSCLLLEVFMTIIHLNPNSELMI